jgi:hypothetical protein
MYVMSCLRLSVRAGGSQVKFARLTLHRYPAQLGELVDRGRSTEALVPRVAHASEGDVLRLVPASSAAAAADTLATRR